MAKQKLPEEHENLERWLVSYGDFMTLLLATFVVLYALSQVDISEFVKLEDSIRKAFNAPSLLEGADTILDGKNNSIFDMSAGDSIIEPLMLEYMSQRYETTSFNQIQESIKELSKNGDLDGVDAKMTETGLLITFKEDLLFYSASAALTDKALKSLDKVGALISQQFAMHNIRVEGHTDSQPISSFMYPSNWELSGARSSSIIRYFISRFKFMPELFSSVGYGETRPIADNSTPQGREKNRRVEVLILKNKYKSFEHAVNPLLKKSKKSQAEFQKNRMEAIQQVKEEYPALNELKVKSSLQKKDNAVKETPINEEVEKTISIKNKTIYEQATIKENEMKSGKRIIQKNINEDDNFLGNVTKSGNILQKDINAQFDQVGK